MIEVPPWLVHVAAPVEATSQQFLSNDVLFYIVSNFVLTSFDDVAQALTLRMVHKCFYILLLLHIIVLVGCYSNFVCRSASNFLN